MKRMTLILLAAFASASVQAQAENKAAPRDFSVPDNVRDARTINLCVDYYGQKDTDKKAAELKELKRRGMLSVKDHDLLNGKQKGLENGNTRCAMYMTRGIPLHEKGKFIGHSWVRTPKIVHVYDDKYYVSQSGIITRVYDRVPGQLPPQLDTKKPKVAPPPVIMHANPTQPAPVDTPHHQTMEK